MRCKKKVNLLNGHLYFGGYKDRKKSTDFLLHWGCLDKVEKLDISVDDWVDNYKKEFVK